MEWTRKLPHRPLLLACGTVLLTWAAWTGPLSAAATAPPKPAAKPAPQAKPAPPPAAAANSTAGDEDETPAAAGAAQGLQPPDGKWLKDEEGRFYFVDKLEKSGPFLRLDDKTVRTRWGINIDVVKEDDKYFYYKVYRPVGSFPAMQLGRHLSPEETRRIEATYAANTPESRRLSFVPFGKGLPTTGQWRNGFAIADMNGDGHPDIVHGPARKSMGNPAVFLGDGKGNWRRWSEARFPPLPFDYGDTVVADFNGDGHMDMALGMHLRGMAVLLGDGKGHFTDWGKGLDLSVPKPGADSLGFSSRAIAVLDWNHDGRPDVLALGEGPRLTAVSRERVRPAAAGDSYGPVIYLNQGDGTWVRKDQGTTSREIFGDSVTVGDFNGDHRPDFATGSGAMGRQSLVNYHREDGAWNAVDVSLVRPQSYIRSVTAADFNGDGRDDLAVGYMSFELGTWWSGIDILYSQADGSWTRRPLFSTEGRLEVSALGHGDLDGDGRTDLVALTGEGETWVYLGDGKGFFTRETATGIPAVDGGCRGYHVELADLDGDGRDEIVADFAGENSPMFAPDRCLSGGALMAWHLGEGR
jgi:hypothetical protein